MQRIILLSVAVCIVISGIIAGFWKLNTTEKSNVVATPVAVQTSEAPKDEPTAEPSVTPTKSATEDSDDEEVDMTNYKPHKLHKDTDKWTDQEWEWWTNAASGFQIDYEDVFEEHFGETPTSDIVQIAQNFGEEVCSVLDKGGDLDDIAEAVVDSGGSKKAQFALAMAVHPGVNNFCPWNKSKLD